jgi:hypothetical protein
MQDCEHQTSSSFRPSHLAADMLGCCLRACYRHSCSQRNGMLCAPCAQLPDM